MEYRQRALLEAAEYEEGDIGEDEKKLRQLEATKNQGINQDLVRETGLSNSSYGYVGGSMHDFYSSATAKGPS